MNGYDLSRIWFDWCFDNASKIRPIHTALFFFIIEHNNRLGWKKEFGLPRQMAMDAIGVKNNRTFTSAFDDLEKWGFITVFERSKNQYSANIISLYGYAENTQATTKAYDKALQKHDHKQSMGIAPIDKQLNNKTLNDETEKNALEFLKSNQQEWETIQMQNKKRFKDWDKMLELYSYKVDEEKLQYDYKVLKSRLFRWMSNWEANGKTTKKNSTPFDNMAF